MTENTHIKSELIEVLTASELLSSSSSQEEFPAVHTESSFMETPTPDLDNLIQRYDNIFLTHEMYYNFVNSKLAPWKNLIEFKYFDTMYQSHRSTKRTTVMLRQQAQKLLAEANELINFHNKVTTSV